MKVQSTLLALCLVGTGFANAQTTNSSTTTTNTTTGTYQNQTDPNRNTSTGTNSTPASGTNMNNTGTNTGTGTYSTTPANTNTGTYSTSPSNTNSSTGTYSTSPSNTNTGTGTYSTSPSTTGTTDGTMNSSTTPSTNNSTYSTTTTTTTTSSDGMATTNTRDAYGTRADQPGRFGVYAGFNNSVYVNEPVNQTSRSRFGYQLGVYGRSAGTVFGQIGAEFRASSVELIDRVGPGPNPKEIVGSVDHYFLAVPAYVGVRIGEALGLRLQAGGELSAHVGNKGNVFNLGMDDVNRIIFGGLLNAGINLGPVTLDAFYNRGLVNVFKNADIKRNMFGFNVGLRF